MIIRSTNQLPTIFEEGCQNQSARLEGIIPALCTSHKNLAVLKSYACFHPRFWILGSCKLGSTENQFQRMMSSTWAPPNSIPLQKSFFFDLTTMDRSYNLECKLLNTT
jgi:hypothetical protein